MKKVQFSFFSGCPNSEPTFNNLKEAIKELNIDIKVDKIDVDTFEKARELNFLGSPSIYIDGIDIYTMQKPSEVNYACRHFDIDNKKTGVISKEFIKDRLKNFI